MYNNDEIRFTVREITPTLRVYVSECGHYQIFSQDSLYGYHISYLPSELESVQNAVHRLGNTHPSLESAQDACLEHKRSLLSATPMHTTVLYERLGF